MRTPMSTVQTIVSRHHLDEDTEVCSRCGAYENDALQGEIGCDLAAEGTNPAYYCGLALTPAEQVLAQGVGLDVHGAMTLKTMVLIAGRSVSGEQLIEMREAFEHRVVEMVAAISPPSDRTGPSKS